jgi:hypothetical protein
MCADMPICGCANEEQIKVVVMVEIVEYDY